MCMSIFDTKEKDNIMMKKKKMTMKRYINVAVAEHLRTLMTTMVRVANHRLAVHKESVPYEITSEPRKIS